MQNPEQANIGDRDLIAKPVCRLWRRILEHVEVLLKVFPARGLSEANKFH